VDTNVDTLQTEFLDDRECESRFQRYSLSLSRMLMIHITTVAFENFNDMEFLPN
jgi:hypothetical protein